MAIALTVTAKGQVTLRKDVLQHLGVRPGDKLSVDLLNDHRVQIQAKPGNPASTIFGLLEQSSTKSLSIEEIGGNLCRRMGRRRVRITPDTNVLLRTVLRDDAEQADAAEALLARATVLAIPIPVFCEFSWVLRRGYRQTASQVADAIQSVCAIETVVTDNLAVDAGVRALRSGGDFADGAIAQQGEILGGTVLATFDRRALGTLRQSSLAARRAVGDRGLSEGRRHDSRGSRRHRDAVRRPVQR